MILASPLTTLPRLKHQCRPLYGWFDVEAPPAPPQIESDKTVSANAAWATATSYWTVDSLLTR